MTNAPAGPPKPAGAFLIGEPEQAVTLFAAKRYRISPMQNRWAEKWAELRTATSAPASGVGVLLLSIVCFIVMLGVVIALVRAVMG